jgi:gas vesicle protein
VIIWELIQTAALLGSAYAAYKSWQIVASKSTYSGPTKADVEQYIRDQTKQLWRGAEQRVYKQCVEELNENTRPTLQRFSDKLEQHEERLNKLEAEATPCE